MLDVDGEHRDGFGGETELGSTHGTWRAISLSATSARLTKCAHPRDVSVGSLFERAGDSA